GPRAPALLVLGGLVWLDDRGPVFFRQERVGKDGKPFRMWKFRTMRVDAEKVGPQLTVGADPRITRVGRWLRKTKVDELPQLLNVLSGEMSLVGPRPEVPRYVAMYTPEQRRVLSLMPGITDPASIRYRDESAVLAEADDPERTYVEEVMPEKIRLNLDYAARSSVLSDTAVILKTILPIGRG
ncbi:MAG TPA: sugar transferase, partial [Longimicrobium sp.]|nr:sugar transferase [Longimicrobium sp.]